jgi:4-hydroxythreonine-4-phosphate dehydrogenase
MIIITLGDPYSINIATLRPMLAGSIEFPIVIIGSLWHWQDQIRRSKQPELSLTACDNLNTVPAKAGIYFIDIGGKSAAAETLTKAERGEIAVKSLSRLAELSESRAVAVLTCPIDKHACALAGFKFPGQTEYFERLWAGAGIMFLCGSRLRVGLITNHLPLSAVEGSITAKLIAEKVERAADTLTRVLGIKGPRIAVCGLNPHCGDHGMFGDFDQRIVEPAIADLKSRFAVQGPFPADTIFWKALAGEYDCVLAMYHDQGLAPLKTVHFDDAINITGGLKHLRVSPDHGPAQDLFLTDRASGASFQLCWELVNSYMNQLLAKSAHLPRGEVK